MAEPCAVTDVDALVVRPAVREERAHPLDRLALDARAVTEVDDSGYAAHGLGAAEAPPHGLLPDQADEARVRDEVAAQQAARLLHEPEEPLEPGPLRIQRGARA